MCLIKPYKGVELLGQGSLSVMALQLGFWSIDNANKAFKPRFNQPAPKGFVGTKFEQAALRRGIVKKAFIAVGPRRTTRITSISPSQAVAALTVPVCVPNPMAETDVSNCSRHSWPILSSPRTAPMSVNRASPIWELWAQTTALDVGPLAARICLRVSIMWVSRKFQDPRRHSTSRDSIAQLRR